MAEFLGEIIGFNQGLWYDEKCRAITYDSESKKYYAWTGRSDAPLIRGLVIKEREGGTK